MLTAHLLRSPGHRTDRFALPGNGMHHDRGGWIAVETPANRHYWFGHRLLMPGPPWAEGIATWRGRWLAENPDPQNRPPRGYLCWESVERDQASLDRAADEEIALEEHVVRVHRGPVPELAAAVLADGAGLEVRPIEGDAEWAECTGITGRAFDDPVDFHAWAQGNRRARAGGVCRRAVGGALRVDLGRGRGAVSGCGDRSEVPRAADRGAVAGGGAG